ncbi:AraC family transcriptional regulator [Mucilaginibacter ginsenosidivorax]|uniref:Helix-turn-helix domain-containing protein n=1 Tax=Mucilaginibacter ginsenosidivorax TaxID=862126 RepID=A0A5B8W565_9SPHI|nr:helix-turn-helix domain-containing protein [Mucilaginibacter ginsenosidivorax]QEC78893.1 helix-turn-helix domain-containing protein [Mucilaginibacter ginsenosidivorax]
MKSKKLKDAESSIPYLTDLISFYKHVNAKPPLHADFDVRELDPEVMKSYDFVAKPFRHSFYCITLFMQGNAQLNGGFWKTNLSRPALYFKTPSQVVSWSKPERWLQEYFIVFTDAFLRANPILAELIFDMPFFHLEKAIPFEIDSQEVDLLSGIYRQVLIEYHSSNQDKFSLITSYVHTLLLHVRRLYNKYSENDRELIDHISDREHLLIDNFRKLIRKSITNGTFNEYRKPLQYFAKELSTHPNHLNAVIKRQKQKTAIAFLHEQICMEAQSMLNQTDQTIKQIAFMLGFSDSSHFGNFFKKQTGKTPATYREQNV